MIVCKIFIDEKDKKKYLIVELAKKNLPENVVSIPEIDEVNPENYNMVYIYPSNLIAISKEAQDAIKNKIKIEDDWKPNTFFTDFTFEMDDYQNNVGMFGFLPKDGKDENQRKKVFDLNNTILVDTSKLWLGIMDGMQHYDNELLKNLDITEPVDEKKIEITVTEANLNTTNYTSEK